MYKIKTPRPRRFLRGAILTVLTVLAAGCLHQSDARFAGREPDVILRYAGAADSVCAAGDFNGWSKTADCYRHTGDGWELRLDLAPGRYSYGLCVNGQAPEPDPEAVLVEDDGFGGANSVLVVR